MAGAGGSLGAGGAVANTSVCPPNLGCAGGPDSTFITVTPNGAAVIQDLMVTGLSCTASSNHCQWSCQAQLPSIGAVQITLSAPGFQPVTLSLKGHSGCCSTSSSQSITLEPNTPAPGCCADLQTDPHNCGACGTTCPSNLCAGGKCQPNPPAFGNFIPTAGLASCDAYCMSIGQLCFAACYTNSATLDEYAGVGVYSNVGNPNNLYHLVATQGCADSFDSMHQYKCCCGEH